MPTGSLSQSGAADVKSGAGVAALGCGNQSSRPLPPTLTLSVMYLLAA
jgi:hypothetical protein